MRKTPAQKAAETRERNKHDALCWAMVKELSTIEHKGDGSTEQAVVELAKRLKLTGDAFWTLDNGYASFGASRDWHMKLRCTRNHPVYGPQLFDLF